MQNRGSHWMRTVARIKDGVTIEQAQADLQHVFSDLGRAYPETDEGRTVHLQPLAQSVVGKSKGPLWTLLARGAGRARHRLRECRRPAAGAGRQARARNGHAHRDRRRPRAAHSARCLPKAFCWRCWERRAACCWPRAMLDLMRLFLIKALAARSRHPNELGGSRRGCCGFRRGQPGGLALSGAAPFRTRSQPRAQGGRQHGRGPQPASSPLRIRHHPDRV